MSPVQNINQEEEEEVLEIEDDLRQNREFEDLVVNEADGLNPEGTSTTEDEFYSGDDSQVEQVPRRSNRIKKPVERLTYMVSDFLFEPRNLKEALSSSNAEEWQRAVNEEYASLQENDSWEEVDLPPNRKLLNCKWVFKLKLDKDGNISRYKARLVAKGYCQEKGIDYNETFSPVVRYESLRFLLADLNFEIDQMDAITAFLQGDLLEDIYIKYPEGYESKNGKVLKLKKSLYGLKQSPRMWNCKLSQALKKFGLNQSKLDPCLYHVHT